MAAASATGRTMIRPWISMAVWAAAAAIVAGGCGKSAAPPAPPTPQVVTATMHLQSVTLTTELPGRVSAFLTAEIRPQVNGLILKRVFTEGAQVHQGEVLYQIDPAPFQAAYESAQANVDAMQKAVDRARAGLGASQAAVERQQATVNLAKINKQRSEDLFSAKAVSASDRDQAATDMDVAQASLLAAQAQIQSDNAAIAAAQAAVKQSQAAVTSAKINLDYTRIVAPIDGRIGRSSVTVGAIVTAYQPAPLATIQSLDPVYIDVPQSTRELNRLKSALAAGSLSADGTDKVKIILEDSSVYSHRGVLKFRDVTVDPSTGSVLLRIVVPNPDSALLPGMFVRAVIEEGVNPKAMLIPQQAVSRTARGDAYTLIVDEQNQVQQRMLTIDRALGHDWLVSDGLKDGDRVIMEGVQKVRPGAAVQVVAPASKPATTAAPAAESH